jgi:hypothetical protein
MFGQVLMMLAAAGATVYKDHYDGTELSVE